MTEKKEMKFVLGEGPGDTGGVERAMDPITGKAQYTYTGKAPTMMGAPVKKDWQGAHRFVIGKLYLQGIPEDGALQATLKGWLEEYFESVLRYRRIGESTRRE